ncbi:MAG TPA: DUF58 domain-containing protein [Cerasibacillus sp.]|uniref:DUF58 domain-containing protein n=1 Tax=Cerasibacillus sp. TaxID=2498711 RepID=UPI002F404CC2
MSSKNWWDRFLFRDKGIVPGKRLLIICGIVSFSLIILGSLTGLSWGFILFFNIFFIGLSLLDFFFLPRKREMSISRVFPDTMERGQEYLIDIKVHNQSEYDAYVTLIDGLDQSFIRPFPLQIVARSKETTPVRYKTRAQIRGQYPLTSCYVRYQSRFGLWQKQMTVQFDEAVKVIPDLTETKNYLNDAQRYLLYEGLTIRKFHSGAGEFTQIRNYVVGDDPRMINWRQTAKLREVMTNEYEPEHGKYVTLLIDCGRMMGAELRETNRLEKSLEAVLTVAAAALDSGDYVSVIAFSKDVHVYVPPRKGIEHLQMILDEIYDLEVQPVESNYAYVFSYMETKQKKRSLCMLFSDVRTFLIEESASMYLERIRRRHLFLIIGIEDHLLLEMTQQPIRRAEDAMLKSTAQQQLLLKRSEKRKWENRGLLMVETEAERLAATAVSYYIDLLNRHVV